MKHFRNKNLSLIFNGKIDHTIIPADTAISRDIKIDFSFLFNSICVINTDTKNGMIASNMSTFSPQMYWK